MRPSRDIHDGHWSRRRVLAGQDITAPRAVRALVSPSPLHLAARPLFGD
jgi:hypothetical protein